MKRTNGNERKYSALSQIALLRDRTEILAKRERYAQIKESVICQALTAARQGPQRELEEHIATAVQLECALVHVRILLVDICFREESFRVRAEVHMKESEVK